MKLYYILLVCVIWTGLAFEVQSVNSPTGNIEGIIENVVFNGTLFKVRKYLGIPYAEAPTGNLRFRKPIPKQKFKSTYRATKMKEICIQGTADNLSRKNFHESEDCLFINIYVPMRQVHRDKRTVIVYFHGGYGQYNYVNGAANFVSGDVLSVVGDVIVVTFNYRLAVLGFFSMEDGTTKGNYGLWDQQLAIFWVHHNIESFGGDPNKITLFGEGQGAVSAILQSFYPGNKGFIRRIIAQNGTPFRALNQGLSPYITQTYPVMKTIRKFGCIFSDMSLPLQCMKNLSISQFKHFLDTDVDMETITPNFDSEFLIGSAEIMLKYPETASGFSRIDLMVGFEDEKDVTNVGLDTAENSITKLKSGKEINTDAFINDMIHLFYGYGMPNFIENIIVNRYKDLDNSNSPEKIQNNLEKFTYDVLNLMPSIRTYLVHRNLTAGFRTFLYKLKGNLGPADGNRLDDTTSSFSVPVIFYEFGLSTEMLKANNMSNFSPTKADIQTSREMMQYITDFAKHGKPTTFSNVSDEGPTETDVNNIPYISLPSGEQQELSHNPSIQFWLQIIPRLLDISMEQSVGGLEFDPPDADGHKDKDISKAGANAVIITLGVITGLLILCLFAMGGLVVFVKIRRARHRIEEGQR